MNSVKTAEAFSATLNDSHPSVNFNKKLAKDGKLSFLRMEIVKHNLRLTTKVHKKPMDIGPLLH